MAKIALAAAFVAGGILLGVATGGLGAFAEGAWTADIIWGASIGYAVGSTLGNLLFPSRTNTSGPRLADTQISQSSNGLPIPFGYGGFRIAGQIVWSTGIQESKTDTTQSAKGGPSNTTTTYSYTCSFAAVFCEGTARISRIWGDSKLIYDTTSKGAISAPALSTGIGTATINIYPTLYEGTEDQEPDPTIQAAQGVNNTSAMRGLCYLVYEDFPLADFGNRLPNIRSEISTGTTQAFTKDVYPPSTVVDIYAGSGPANLKPRWPVVDTQNRLVYVFDEVGMVVQKIDLGVDNTQPVERWEPDTAYTIGNQVLDVDGNVQTATSTSSDGHSGLTEPTWTAGGIGVTTSDHHVVWTNIGVGPEAIAVTGDSLINPDIQDGDLTFEAISTPPSSLAVDSNGYLWMCFTYSSATRSPFTFYKLLKVDPNTFTVVHASDLPAPAATIQTVQTNDGSSLVYVWTLKNFSGGGHLHVFDSKDGSQRGDVDFHTLILNDTNYNGCIAPDGSAYIIDGSASAAWAVLVFNNSGVTRRVVREESDTSDFGTGALYNAADHSLIVATDKGALLKVDIASMTVGDTLPQTTIQSGGGLAGILPKNYASGQVPTSGRFYVYGPTGGSASHWAQIDAATMTVESSTLLSSWAPLFNFAEEGWFYDPSTDSIVANDGLNYTYRFFMNRTAVNGQTLDNIVADILTRAGLTSDEFDVTALSGITVLGYPIGRVSDAKSLLQPLCAAYMFDLMESDFKLKAVLRGGGISITIPESDLGITDTSGNTFELQKTIAQQQDLPRDITVTYADPALDYQQGKQMRRRNSRVVKTTNQSTVELPLTMNGDTAAQIAQQMLQMVWAERNQYSWKLWKAKYLLIDPSDVVQFTYGSAPYQSRITKTNVGQNRTMEISGVSENNLAYVTSVAGVKGTGFPKQTLGLPASTSLFLLDLPLLQDADSPSPGNTGFYWMMSSPNKGWPGAVLYQSADNQKFDNLDFSSNLAQYGTVGAPTPAPRAAQVWDNITTITVRMTQGSLTSSTDLNVLNGANAFVLGKEVMQFVNATLNGDGTYTLSRLLRGRRGTEWACSQHGVGETFLFLGGGGIHRTVTSTSLINALRYYKAVTIGQPLTAATPLQLTQQGNDLKPYAPCSLNGTRS